jgi:hypothetical protein
MNVKSKAALSTLGVVVMSSIVGALTYFIMEFIPVIYVLVCIVSLVFGYLLHQVYENFRRKYEIEELEKNNRRIG